MSQGIADKNSILQSFLKREKLFTKEFEENKIFDVDVDDRPKIFITFPYPYMNGSLHLGHAYSSCRLDVYARYKRLNGYNVLYPWAWHWTGEAVYGTVHRIRENDESVIKRLIELDGVEPEEIDNLRDASYLVKYFTSRNRPIVKRLGLSIDWSREFHTTSLHPLYDKFIKWQIRTLYKRGFIVKGSHPLVWCPVDKSPTGDHDRLKGEGVRPEKYVLVKFKLDNKYLVAGTLRPETIFGSTNIWVNPNGRYVEAVVGDETWIISNEAYEKLVHQNFDVKKYRNIDIKTLLG
ncbi:TPA: leucine--tRNA ligase, partial [Candidatus Geothermarchaeota archaeon]|nr:leucine--tRNA ligase [Candidatus Geothermarchaeota archaeon]